jgi:hypothetical protein
MNATEMTALRTSRIVARVIKEVAGTISTNGIQELSKEERGGVSQFGYVRVCLMSTAYNAVRAMPGFNLSYNDFCNDILNQVTDGDHCDACGGWLPDGCICDPLNDEQSCEACGCNDGTCQHSI